MRAQLKKWAFWVVLLAASCQSQTSDPSPVPPSSEVGCDKDTACESAPGERCDFLFLPEENNGSKGSCRVPCKNQSDCHNTEICSPLSGFCEVGCAGNPGVCNERSPDAGLTSTCVANQFCGYMATSQTPCPGGLKSTFTNSYCRVSCVSNADCPGGLICDIDTKTCELTCGLQSNAVNVCSQFNISASTSSNGTPIPGISYACSASTATCAYVCPLPTGQPPSDQCATLGSLRNTCIQTGSTSGTCENLCTKKGALCNNDKGTVCGQCSSTQDCCKMACKTENDCPVAFRCAGGTVCAPNL